MKAKLQWSGRLALLSLSIFAQSFDHPYLPSPEKATGAAVIIAPGGGHRVSSGYAVRKS